MPEFNAPCQDLQYIYQRVGQKSEDYIAYHFTRQQNDILKTFFDLAQEFDSLQDFYRICVTVPGFFLNLHTRLYLNDPINNRLELVCDSRNGLYHEPEPAPAFVRLTQGPYVYENSYLVPIARRHHDSDDAPSLSLQSRLMGVLEVFPRSKLGDADLLFFTKYTNRIAYNLHNRRLMQQNIRHLEFINNLVMDIEHNVIIPNMYFRHLFRQLRKNIDSIDEVVRDLSEVDEVDKIPELQNRLEEMHRELDNNHRQLLDHHATTSLFLESLFRRDHFKEGHLVLRAKSCMVEDEIIKPQLDNYLNRLEIYGINVEYPQDMEKEFPLSVDIGLLAQVYANLFSNAVKYTDEVTSLNGAKRKVVAYGRELHKDYFGPGKDGIKFNVFTTGQHLFPEELEKIFEDGYRGSNAGKSSGTGHGLSFIKQVVEIHGGRVGCELVEDGNNFFFVLPFVAPPEENAE